MCVYSSEILCVLGDNGAGKSTLIKTLSGVHPPDEGRLLVDGEPVRFSSPRGALARGIATVYQDLAMVPMLSVVRNFFLGAEPTRGVWPFSRLDLREAEGVVRAELARMGVELRDVSVPVSALSGGQRQAVAIARAIHFGARVLILDEPTSALGVKQAGIVLRFVREARARGCGVILITHNPHHAYLVGDRFTILNRGRCEGTFTRAEITQGELVRRMAGGEELEALQHELRAS
ncbi:ATP-binding cassette domain-containing protein [Polyangium spumosum]|uniref:ATP-binding cassette domain-containing protein n=2 Tax=Polyangium spumosum TaxID=889282 RepID=A0A6N7PJV9_9BACT|nr:ATP-binding cassette domain-containing protein [Polyangium spumosum]